MYNERELVKSEKLRINNEDNGREKNESGV